LKDEGWKIVKQKVVVRAVISRRERVLLLRRHGGRPSIAGLFELPGGSLHQGEQPIDALKRSLQIHAGVEPETFRLRDVMSFVDPEVRELQYLFIVYDVTIEDNARVTLDDEYDHYQWTGLREIQPNEVTNSTAILLGLGEDGLRENNDVSLDMTDTNDAKNTTVIVHSDGGSRGNPGPTAAAYVVENETGEILDQGGHYLGDHLTNGIAEYYGVLFGLQAAAKLGAKVVNFYSDSLMVVNQLNGLLRVKSRDVTVYNDIKKLMFAFDRVHFRHVHREYNRMADGLVNKILDEQEGKS
jgi:ribonuclease HI/8-oxo-dGTP pyrophosphatase MutT (NUDIX family)